jgi:hypothetical protein
MVLKSNHIDVDLHIAGFEQSTSVASLLQAFQTLSLDVTLPGLQSKLLSAASLEGNNEI